MQVTLFKALKSIKIDDERATAVVDDLEDYMKGRMEEVTMPIRAEIMSVSKQLDGLRSQLTLFSILIAFVGAMIAAGPIIAKLID